MTLMTIRGLEKSYAGKKKALDGVEMEIEAGRIIGLLGPNAAGKTTLLKTMAGLLRPDAGEITYPGGVSGTEAKKTVSLLPDSMSFPGWMKVRDAFRFYADLYPDYSPQRAAELTELLSFSPDEPLKRLSKGMRERVALALAFSRKASLFLLDEPLGGIDPLGKTKVLESILATPLENATILLSTHLVKDVEQIFDSVFFLSAGRILFHGDCERLREEKGKTVEQQYLEVFSSVQAD